PGAGPSAAAPGQPRARGVAALVCGARGSARRPRPGPRHRASATPLPTDRGDHLLQGRAGGADECDPACRRHTDTRPPGNARGSAAGRGARRRAGVRPAGKRLARREPGARGHAREGRPRRRRAAGRFFAGPGHRGHCSIRPGGRRVTRVLLADDHLVVRTGLRALLEEMPGIAVVAETGDGLEALRLISEKRPELALLDISMPGLNGLEVAARAHKQYPGVRLVILSMYVDDEFVRRALASGAVGYILKNADRSELELALRTVIRGET